MKKILFVCLKFIGILMVSVLVGVLCMVVAYMIPLSEQSANVLESFRILDEEGWYPTMPYIKEFTGTYDLYLNSPATLDNYTDGLMISEAVLDPQHNYLYAAMISDYARYWSGFVVVLRPMLLLFDYGEIRMLNILVQMFLIFVLGTLLSKRKGKTWCFWSLTVYGLMTPYCMGLSLQNSSVFYIGLLGTILLLLGEEFFQKKGRYFYLFFILGIITVYFDFLTYPLFTWAFPAVVWIVVGKHDNVWRYLKDVALTGICWVLGYAGMWAGKWIVASNVLDVSISKILAGRIELHSVVGGTEVHFLQNLERNLEKWVNVQTTCILLAWCIWFCFKSIKQKGLFRTGKSIPLTIIGCGSIAWLFVMRYHTFVHAFFTHRIYCTAFCAILAACICMVEEKTEEKLIHRRALIPMAFVVIVLSVGVTTQCKVRFRFHNGDQPPRHILLQEGSFISETIMPRYKNMKEFEIGLIADAADGEFLIEIYDQMDLLFREIVPFSEVMGGKVYPLQVVLKEEYKELNLFITTQNCKGANGSVYVTDGVFPLVECSEALMDGNALGGQITHSFVYLALPGMKTCLNFFLIVIGVITMLFADGYFIGYSLWQKLKINRK